MFKNLEKFDISRATSWVDMPELGDEAAIRVRPAPEDNPSYWNAMLAKTGNGVAKLAKSTKGRVELLKRHREEDRELYPLYVIDGWRNLDGDPDTAKEGELDEEGHVVHTRRSAVQLCEQLPRGLFDRVRAHAASPESFYPEDEELPPEPEDLLGNSESD